MSLFEFLKTIASVVVAFGVGEIAKYWGELIRQRKQIQKFSWLQIAWSLNVLLNGLFYWIGMWAYSDLEFNYFYQIFALVVPSLIFVMTCYAITNLRDPESHRDLNQKYWLDAKSVFITLALFGYMSLVADWLIVGHNLDNLWITLVLTSATFSLAFVKNHMYHYVYTSISVVLNIAFILSPLSVLG